jgi:hypothetical protein
MKTSRQCIGASAFVLKGFGDVSGCVMAIFKK